MVGMVGGGVPIRDVPVRVRAGEKLKPLRPSRVNDAGEAIEDGDGVSGLTTPELGVNTDKLIRCQTPGCGNLLAEYASRPWRFKCRKCKGTLTSGPAIGTR
jgi:hypothetical protein